jgi:hypothetical protein
MKRQLLVMALMVGGVTFFAGQAAAQGPAGAGAGAAVASSNSGGGHSLNPIHWIKKEPKRSADSLDANSDQTKRLDAKLQAQGVLAADADVKEACTNFQQISDCLAGLHASHSLGLNFGCVRSNMTGVRTGIDVSACRVPESDKPQSLIKTIKLLKPDANAKRAAKDAEAQAKEDLKDTGA